MTRFTMTMALAILAAGCMALEPPFEHNAPHFRDVNVQRAHGDWTRQVYYQERR